MQQIKSTSNIIPFANTQARRIASAQLPTPKIHWLQLKADWLQAAQMVALKQHEIDQLTEDFLAGKGAPPSFEAQQELFEMRAFESTKRADLDEYIFE